MSSESSVGVYFQPASASCRKVSHKPDERSRGTRAYLFCLALEPLLRLVRPPSRKGCFPRLDHAGIERMNFPKVAKLGFDCRHHRPSTTGRMLQVLLERLIILLPPIKRLVAQETYNVVGAAGKRLKEESGFRELAMTCQWTVLWNYACYCVYSHLRAKPSCAAIAMSWERARSRWTFAACRPVAGSGMRLADSRR